MRYKGALQKHSLHWTIFKGHQCCFLDERRKTLKLLLHKICAKRIQAMYINAFFSTRIKYSPIEKSLKRLNWSIDKLSCKTLFGLLILDLFQFYTLNNLVEMYKIEKIVGNNNNWAITNNWIIKWNKRESDFTENSLNGTVFTATCDFFQASRVKNLLWLGYNYLLDWNTTDSIWQVQSLLILALSL